MTSEVIELHGAIERSDAGNHATPELAFIHCSPPETGDFAQRPRHVALDQTLTCLEWLTAWQEHRGGGLVLSELSGVLYRARQARRGRKSMPRVRDGGLK